MLEPTPMLSWLKSTPIIFLSLMRKQLPGKLALAVKSIRSGYFHSAAWQGSAQN